MTTASNMDQADIPDLFLPKEHKPALDLKGSVFTLTVLRLQNNNLEEIDRDLKERIAQGPRFFEDAPIVVDLEILKDQKDKLDLAGLLAVLRDNRLVPVGVRHGDQSHQEAALAAGLAIMKGGAIRDLPTVSAPAPRKTAAKAESHPPPEPQDKDVASAEPAASPTKVIHQPVRSGQQIYARGGDLVVLAAVNAGAEIVADGNIHVYAPLRGRALAGVSGDESARIFCHSMEAELVAVAGHYRVFEQNVPAQLHRKPVQVFLKDDQLVVEPLD